MSEGIDGRASTADFDLHGLVGVSASGAGAADLRALSSVLGEPGASLERNPDIRVHFTPSLGASQLSWIEPGRSGFSAEGFFVLSGGRRPARARVSFDAGTGAWDIECERGRPYIPLLQPVVRLAALRHRAVPLHASACEVDGQGVIASGWAHGGKTTALLAFMEHGARFLADDWVLLTEDGRRVYGLPGDVTISPAQAGSPLVRARLGGSAHLAKRALAGAGRALAHGAGGGAAGSWSRAASKLGSALARRAAVTLAPEVLFGAALAPSATPDVLFLMNRHDADRVHVEPVASATAAARLASASTFEELPLLRFSLGYRFAFPESEAPAFFEEAAALRERMLASALAGVRSYMVRHPEGATPAQLHRAMARCLEAAA